MLSQTPAEIARPWQIQSFFHDVEIAEKSVICVDFMPDGSAWLAVSDGLYHYDGYRWRHYTTEHGLPSNYVRCVSVLSDGTLWIGTDRGAGTFDGVSFDAQGTTGKLAGPSVRRIVEDPDGSLWFCCDQWPVGKVAGGLTRMLDGQFTTWRSGDGLPSDYVSDYVRDSQGRQFVLTNKGLAEFSNGGFRQPLKEAGLRDAETYVWSLVESDKHGLIAATNTHFFRFNDGQWRFVSNSVPGLVQPKLTATRDGEIYTCSSGRRPTIYRWNGKGFEIASRQLTEIDGGVQMLAEDPLGAIWIVGYERLLRWERLDGEWELYGQLGAPRLKDSTGGIWFDGPEDGLVRYDSEQWHRFAGVSTPLEEDRAGKVWMQSTDGIAVWSGGQQVNQIDVPSLEKPQLIGVDRQGVVWAFGDTASGLPAVTGFDGDQWTLSELSQFPHHFVLYASSDPQSGMWIVIGESDFPPYRLVHVDQGEVKEIPLPDRAQISERPRVYALDDGKLFISGFFGLLQASQDGQSWSAIETPSPTVAHMIQLRGETWLSCRGHVGGHAALVRYRNGVWQPFLDLQGVFVGKDRDDAFYVASRGEIQVVTTGVDRFKPPITTPFKARASSVVATGEGAFWAGVGHRPYRYVPNGFPPETDIVHGRNQLQKGEDLLLRVRALERFKSTNSASKFAVSTRLARGEWTPFEPLTDELRISDLELGSNRVQVRVQNAAGQIDATPATFEFRVLPIPLQSRTWFKTATSLCCATMICLVGLATLNWSRARHLARNLEREVTQKTNLLSSSEQEYRILFEDSQDAICLFGTDGVLQSCNGVARDLLGLSAEQAVSISNVLADENEESRFQHELQRKGHLRGVKFRIRKQNADVIDAILSVNTRRHEADAFIGYQVIIRDISDLVQLQRRLSETQKVEAIGRMAGGIAHDFNNFLAVVMYGVELVKLKSGENPAIDEGLQMISHAAERGKKLTSQIQTFSRAPAIQLDVVDVHEVLSQIPSILQGVLPDTIELVLELDDGLGLIYADPHQLEQVVVNLAVNACQAMPIGGKLTIQATNVEIHEQRTAKPRFDAPGRYVLLRVIDTGEGMDAATRERIFDPFFTTKSHGQGTGLGLAIVYGIVKQFSGRIEVRTDPGEGTCFELFFPVCHEAKMDSGEPKVLEEARGTETILVVEDEADIRQLARRSLERYGYTVYDAEDGAAAQTLIETKGHIDLVVSDVVMKGSTSGIDLARWLRTTRSDVAVLLISGYPQASQDGVLQEIEVPFLKKPFHPSKLASRIRQILDAKPAVTEF